MTKWRKDMVKTLGDIVNTINASLEASRAANSELIQSAGGPVVFLQRECPNLLVGAPADMTVEHLVDRPVEWYRAAAVRSSRCAQCPKHGGACVTERQMVLDNGMQPLWQGTHLTLRQCDKWETWVQVQRLMNSGVPAVFAARASETVAVEDQNEEVLAAFMRDPRGKILEIQGGNIPWVRSVALRMMWKVFWSRSRVWGRYVLGASLLQRARDFYAKDIEDPYTDYEEGALLVLDTLPTVNMPEWWRERMGMLIYERWTHGLCTIVTTDRDPVNEAYPMVGQVDEADHLIVVEE
jgi:hypothetical protein